MKVLIDNCLTELTPKLIAEAFWNMSAEDQAIFFNELHIAADFLFPLQLQAITEEDGLTLAGRELLDRIIDECKELPDQQWKTIDEFMAEPIEGWCFLIHRKFNNRTMGNYSLGRFWIDGEISKEEHITHVMPITTPEAPK